MPRRALYARDRRLTSRAKFLPLSPERLPLGAKLALYRLIRRRAARAAAPLDPASVDPATAGWRTTLARSVALVRAGRWAEADAWLARGLAVFPGDPGLLIEHALAADGAGRHREAISRWKAALAAAPSAPDLLFQSDTKPT